MTRNEYMDLFHKYQLNLVAFKRLMDCDEEISKVIEAEYERGFIDGLNRVADMYSKETA